MQRKSLPHLFYFVTICLFFGIFLFRGMTVLDPDFGWHIRMGEIIMQNGIPRYDPLSYTMAHYPAIDHEWLTNSIMAFVFPAIGMVGLAVFFSALAIVSLLIASTLIPPSAQKWRLLPFFLAGATFMSFAGVRTQVITWFFLAVFLKIMFDKRFVKTRWFLAPLLFLPWVNLHGAFASGIVLLGLITGVRILEDFWKTQKTQYIRTIRQSDNLTIRDSDFLSILSVPNRLQGIVRAVKHNKQELLSVVLSILATFLNPYGPRIWWEIWMQISDRNLRWTIAEWTPSIDLPNFLFWAFIALSCILTLRYRRRYSSSLLAVYLFLLIAGLSSKRHIPLWVIWSLPMATQAMLWLFQEAKGVLYGAGRFVKAYYALLVVCLLLFSLNIYIAYFAMLSGSEAVFYPGEAAQYLKHHAIQGNLWSPYDWNGYLVWKVPGRRVFIDGMMPSWREHHWEGESAYAFDDYNKLLDGKLPLRKVMTQYNIHAILLPSTEMDTAFFKNRQTTYKALNKQIKQLRLKKLYEDQKVVIYTD